TRRRVSGYRPRARQGSRHRVGRALDVQVEGVARKELATFLQTIPGTGVGYYPNSDLTHVDVREQSYAWVDQSGPGERAKYVAWPEAVDATPGTGAARAEAPPTDDGASGARAAALAETKAALADLSIPAPAEVGSTSSALPIAAAEL